MEGLSPEQQRQFMAELERRQGASTPTDRPAQGFEAALGGADTIGEAPWATRNIGGLPSVTQALRGLPAIGGMIGGLLGASGGPGPAVGGAALGGAGGEAISQLGFRGLTGGGKANPVESALNIGKEAAIQGASELGGRVVLGGALRAGGKRLMHSALKPNPSLMREAGTTAPELVKTLLDEGVNVTPGGLDKLQRLVTATNDEIKQLVKNTPGEIQKEMVAARVLPTAQRLSQQVNPQKALKDVGKTVTRFMEHPTMPGTLSVPEAQALKVGTYKQIGKDYGKLSNATVETQKALARGLKEEIEAKAPGIKNLNAREADLMAAQDAVAHRVSIAGNRDPVGFAWVTQNPQTFLAALMDRSPVVKSMLARGMYQSAGAASNVSPQLIRAAVVALTSGESDAAPAPE